tara:strand:+ start:94 stop:348 length:255 start_codon:yes stop_codon:yes gene_type:complete
METGSLSLIITFNSECTSVKFKGACDGEPTNEQSAYGAAIYAAVQDIANNEEILMHYLELANTLYREDLEIEAEKKQFELKLVH